MSDGNGHESATQRFLAGALSEPRVRLAGQAAPRSTAELSSAERSAQTDALIQRVLAIAVQVNRLNQNAVAVDATLQAHEDAIAHANGFMHAMTLWQRMRWLVLGR